MIYSSIPKDVVPTHDILASSKVPFVELSSNEIEIDAFSSLVTRVILFVEPNDLPEGRTEIRMPNGIYVFSHAQNELFLQEVSFERGPHVFVSSGVFYAFTVVEARPSNRLYLPHLLHRTIA